MTNTIIKDWGDATISHHITGKTKLTPAMLLTLKWMALHDGNFPKLTQTQQKALLVYAMDEAEKYNSGHSMRYTILRDVTKAIYWIGRNKN